MNKYTNEVLRQRIDRTAAALERHGFTVYRAEDRWGAADLVESLLEKGCTVGVGGSATLDECRIIELLRSPEYRFIDRYEPGLSREAIGRRNVEALSADVYITGSNAVTEDGFLYNVDGNGNRIAAIAFGPASVIIIVGSNKIVRDLDEAVARVKSDAAPANCKRLSCDTYCAAEGRCVSLGDPEKATRLGQGCSSDTRICCDYLVCGPQRNKGRIKVIIVDEPLGF